MRGEVEPVRFGGLHGRENADMSNAKCVRITLMIQYTSRGLGTNSFRLRINCKPEITIFTLKTTKKKKKLMLKMK